MIIHRTDAEKGKKFPRKSVSSVPCSNVCMSREAQDVSGDYVEAVIAAAKQQYLGVTQSFP